MKTQKLNKLTKKFLLGILITGMTLFVSSCATKVSFLNSSVVPAAKGTVKVKKDKSQYVVDPKGKAAIKTLATVLNSSKDFTVAIEGHTDNVPIKTKVFEDNWDLSAARATSIVRVLTKDNGFDSGRITASEKSKFHPVGINTTAEGRANNRRTEVILSPDLQEIYKLLYQ